MRIHVILVAAGSGSRFAVKVKKQFADLAGKPLFEYALEFFLRQSAVDQVVLVLPEADLQTVTVDGRVITVAGGKTRAESVKSGFDVLQATDDDAVLVHDAARPFLTQELFDRIAAKIAEAQTAIPALPIAETIKSTDGQKVLTTIDRNTLRAAQTPQGATYGLLRDAYKKCKTPLAQITDEAMLLENCGFPVFLVEGEKSNIKVTTPEDLAWAEFWLQKK